MGPVSDDRVGGSLLREKMEGRRVSSTSYFVMFNDVISGYEC
jgi:hypothetical protein